jgi:outer membrane receptor protein involved in Fe transport
MKSWIRGLGLVSGSFVTAYHSAHAQPAAETMNPVTAPAGSSDNLDEIVVNGIRRGDLILPTTVTSTSAYGLDLGVMDTPRNNTLLSKAQLDALNIQNPGGFSYLTSSSYSDASFGQPNVPRIRGQYADMFFNGMRDSFTLNGYGAPISFNSVDSVDIVKGPASVQAGPGAGVGGAIDITTKMPSFNKPFVNFSLEADTQQKRRAAVDFGAPLTSNTAARVSFTTDDSGSYYYDMYFHQQSLFAAVLTEFTSQYSVLFTGGIEDTRYRENDGINRVNQALIDNGTYLTGAPAPGDIYGIGTVFTLGPSTVPLNDRIIIDEPPGTGAHSLHAKAQIIQTFKATDDFTVVNNTFYDYMNRYNQTEDYYADTAKGSYTLENKTDFKVKFSTGPVSHDIDAGFTYRYAHVLDIQNYNNEPVSVFDLSQSPNTWIFPASEQPYEEPYGTFLYNGAFNHPQWGAPGRGLFINDSVDSNLQDAAIFLEHRIQFSPQWSVLYGVREDVVQLNYSDPLGGPVYESLVGPSGAEVPEYLPQRAATGWYGLHNGNISVVYSPTTHVSAYLTYNNAQYVDPTANDGAVGVWAEAPTAQLRQDTTLEEAGLKFDLFDKSLFLSTAIFHQTRSVATGEGGLGKSQAHIKGAEIELNYQPDPHFFATASYSYLHTVLDTPSGFYNFPAYAGTYVDGLGTAVVYQPNQRFLDPGVPEHLFNVLANYKHSSGIGGQANIQVTGPVAVTQSGYINESASNTAAVNGDFYALPFGPGGVVPLSVVGANGYYKSPEIPWQYTVNTAVFYGWQNYVLKFEVYNLTSKRNLVNDIPFYGNDFIQRLPPRSYDLTLTGKF